MPERRAPRYFGSRFAFICRSWLVQGWCVMAAVGCGDGEPPNDHGRNNDWGGSHGGGAPGASSEWANGGPLVVNEVVTDNEGTSVDESGETDDWLELLNVSASPLELSRFALTDNRGVAAALPHATLPAGKRFVVWAHDTPEQGLTHVPLKLSAGGEHLVLTSTGTVSDELKVPSLAPNESYARFPDGTGSFAICRYASPGRENGQRCAPTAAPSLPATLEFAPFELSDDYPEPAGPIAISEAALRPARFVELVNESDTAESLAEYRLRLAETAPGEEYPGPEDGLALALPEATVLLPGERTKIEVSPDEARAAIPSALFEGVLTLFAADGAVADRWDFMRWPEDAILARFPDRGSHAVFCKTATPGQPNLECDPVPSRDVGDRVRHLRTPGDFAALAEGGSDLGMASVKFVYDMQQEGAIHLLSSRVWPLHYTFVREVIDHQAPLDRCDPEQDAEFNAGWYAFSQTEYFRSEGRRYLLGTLVHHSGPDLHTVEYAVGDEISAEDMRRGFYAVMAHVPTPSIWQLRPEDESQTSTVLGVNGTVPIVDSSAPFNGIAYQPLTPGVAYGTLKFVPTAELDRTALGPEVIVVTDDVPNDIPVVGGLITETLQTPLAHVNVLSQNRGTPNMALVHASEDSRVAPYIDSLVRLEVAADGFAITAADPEEAEAHWASIAPSGEVQSPRLDLEVRDSVDLSEASYAMLPVIGAKAAQLAELRLIDEELPPGCADAQPWSLLAGAFAVPVVHFVEHFQRSGAAELLDSLEADIAFRTNPRTRAEGLEAVREAILEEPVEGKLLASLEGWIWERFRHARVRLRSSSNAEDLPGFNGAGLYTSTSVELDDPERSVEDGLRTVWASLYNARAYDERELARIDHRSVAMGVLVHEAFLTERANGVAVSRNVLDPSRSDIYYMNTQLGEASVTNPAPGVVTEQLTYQWPPRFPSITYQSRSSLIPEEPVLTEREVVSVACALRAIHLHFAELLDSDGSEPWFAMETEFKFVGQGRDLVIKQARPHTFGSYELIGDCRGT